MIVAFYLFMRI